MHSPQNPVQNLYTLIKDARKLAIISTIQEYLVGTRHTFATSFFHGVYHEKLTTGNAQAHLSSVFFDTWEDVHTKNPHLRELIKKDAKNIATAVLGHAGTTLQEPEADSAFATRKAAYDAELQAIKIKHIWIMSCTMVAGYVGLVAVGIYGWCTWLSPIHESVLMIDGMKAQLLAGLQNGTLSRLDQRLLELAIEEAEIVQGRDVLILTGITLLVLIGLCSFWALSKPIDRWRDEKNSSALVTAVEAITSTALTSSTYSQQPQDTNIRPDNIATLDGRQLINALVALKQDEVERDRAVSL